MKLANYLKVKNETRASFSRRTGISEGTISLLCRGEIWLSRPMAEKIYEATGGRVTPTDFMETEAAAR